MIYKRVGMAPVRDNVTNRQYGFFWDAGTARTNVNV